MLPHCHQTGINLLCIYILYILSLSYTHTHIHTKNKNKQKNWVMICVTGLRLHNGTFNHILWSHMLCISQNTKAATTLCFLIAACTILWAHSTSTAWHATHCLPSARCSLTQNQVKKLSFQFSLVWCTDSGYWSREQRITAIAAKQPHGHQNEAGPFTPVTLTTRQQGTSYRDAPPTTCWGRLSDQWRPPCRPHSTALGWSWWRQLNLPDRQDCLSPWSLMTRKNKEELQLPGWNLYQSSNMKSSGTCANPATRRAVEPVPV